MKKIIVNVLFLILSFCLVGCVADEQKQFDSSLKVGLFQGISENNPELTICLEFTEMDTMEYVKRDFYKVKDLSTIDTKFFSTYWVNFIISTKNENYVVKFSEMISQNSETTDTYKFKGVQGDAFGRKLNLTDVNVKLIDIDDDKIVDEFELTYKLNDQFDTAKLKFISEGEFNDFDSHHRFKYEMDIYSDERITFSNDIEKTFIGGKQLIFNINKIDGFKVSMYVNEKLYEEKEFNDRSVLQFKYVTGYKKITIEFKLVKLEY